jgi:hypothetical protein
VAVVALAVRAGIAAVTKLGSAVAGRTIRRRGAVRGVTTGR